MRPKLNAIVLVLTGILLTRTALAQNQPAPSHDDVVRDIMGPDRDARRKAFRDGAYVLTEDDVLNFAQLNFTTDDEREEAKLEAATALARMGTAKSWDLLLSYAKDTPACLDPDPEGGGKHLRYDYKHWAAFGLNRLLSEVTFDKVDASVKGMAPEQQAEALAGMFDQGQSAYVRFRPDGVPDRLPYWWRIGLASRLEGLGAAGAEALAHQIDKEGDPDTRARMCEALWQRWGDQPMRAAFDKGPLADKYEAADDAGKTAMERELFSRTDARTRAAMVTAIRAVLRWNMSTKPGSRGKGDQGGASAEGTILGFVEVMNLTELEKDLMDFAGGTVFDDFRGDALYYLCTLGSDADFDFVAACDKPYRGLFDDWPAHQFARQLNPRYLALLEREPSTTVRFALLADRMSEPTPEQLTRMKAVLARVKAEPPPQDYYKNLAWTNNAENLARAIEIYEKKTAATGGGKQ